MKNTIHLIHVMLWIWITSSAPLGAQPSAPFQLLEQEYPALMAKFGNELKNQKANYLFAIDVSGTMNKYENIVVPAMQQFVASLAEGDNVNIIRFGTQAKVSLGGFSDIDKDTKKALNQFIETIYQKDATLYAHTDLNLLIEQINKQLQTQKNNLTFLFILTDFINDPAPGQPTLTEAICNHHKKRLAARAVDHSIYTYALQLPVTGAHNLQQFKNAMPASYNFETFSVTTPGALKNWFDKKKTEILLDKFRAIVQRKMTDLNFAARPEVNIDGHVRAAVSWTPNELFDALSVDSLRLRPDSATAASYTCRENTLPALLQEAAGTISLAQIKHQHCGFHCFAGEIDLAATLPTRWDNELQKLEIPKPQLHATLTLDRLLFTFPLPLWLTALGLFLILCYAVGVVRAALRNKAYKWKINGKIDVDYRGRNLLSYPVNGEKEVGIGIEGKPVTITAYHCDWQLTLYQKTFSSFKICKKPVYKITMTQGTHFVTPGGTYGRHDVTSFSKGSFAQIDDFTVTWNA